jgi:transposase
MFSDTSLEVRMPASHPLRKLRAVVDAQLLQFLFSIRSERQLVEAIDYNLLYRWIVGLNMDDEVRDHSTFSVNRERLLNEDLARAFFERVKLSAQRTRLARDKYLSADGTLIEACASQKSYKHKDDDSSLAMPRSRAKRCCGLPSTTSFARAASAAGGTRIMRETGGSVHPKWARRPETGFGDGRDRRADTLERPEVTRSRHAACLMWAFSAAR